jgi:hypothetical protein
MTMTSTINISIATATQLKFNKGLVEANEQIEDCLVQTDV